MVSGVGGFGDEGVWRGCGGVVLAGADGVRVSVSSGGVVGKICCVV